MYHLKLTSRQEACLVTLRVKKPVVLCEMHLFTHYHLIYRGTTTVCWPRKQQLLKHWIGQAIVKDPWDLGSRYNYTVCLTHGHKPNTVTV